MFGNYYKFRKNIEIKINKSYYLNYFNIVIEIVTLLIIF